MTVVDRFSRAVHFIPLPKVPTAAKTGEVLVQQVLRPPVYLLCLAKFLHGHRVLCQSILGVPPRIKQTGGKDQPVS